MTHEHVFESVHLHNMHFYMRTYARCLYGRNGSRESCGYGRNDKNGKHQRVFMPLRSRLHGDTDRAPGERRGAAERVSSAQGERKVGRRRSKGNDHGLATWYVMRSNVVMISRLPGHLHPT